MHCNIQRVKLARAIWHSTRRNYRYAVHLQVIDDGSRRCQFEVCTVLYDIGLTCIL